MGDAQLEFLSQARREQATKSKDVIVCTQWQPHPRLKEGEHQKESKVLKQK
jgi:hypothetical protein